MKIVVIGGGPGGYVCAIRLAQLGGEVTLVEKGELGGTCLNVGCIPTKALLHTAEVYTEITQAKELGLKAQAEVDWPGVQHRKQAVVDRLVGGVGGLLKANGVAVINGTASFTGGRQLSVTTAAGEEVLDFDKAVIAVGAGPKIPPISGADLPGVITSTEALSLPAIPERLVVIGGGVIGCEMAGIYQSFGSQVTILEALPELLVNMEPEIVSVLKSRYAQQGIDIHTNCQVQSIAKADDGLTVDTGAGEFAADYVLMATGRGPDFTGLGLETAGVVVERGFIAAAGTMQTTNPDIYAIGDCNGGIQLAHVASAEGEVAAEHICGHESKTKLDIVPSGVYTSPELAGVGLTEAEAVAKGHTVKTGVFSLNGNGKSLISGDGDGLVKFVADAATDEILGLHLAAPRATDIIQEGALALRLEATLEEVTTTIHPHPTIVEAVLEGALAANGRAIHQPPRR